MAVMPPKSDAFALFRARLQALTKDLEEAKTEIGKLKSRVRYLESKHMRMR